MAFIKNVVSIFTGSEPEFPSTIPFTEEDPCAGCADPCEAHPQLPGYLQKKIEGGPLVGSMKPYKRHIMVTEGTSRTWAERLEEADTLTKVVGELVESKGDSVKYRSIVTACDPMLLEDSAGDAADGSEILLFPELVLITGVNGTNALSLVSTLLEKGTIPQSITTTPLKGKAWIFVCTHKKRDKRCGVAGPMLVDEFREAAKELGMTEAVTVYGCSHFGGHKFAGNIIIYHRNPVISGNWYGRVKTCHVRPILQTTVEEGRVFKELWRGAMQRDDDLAKPRRDW
ncbi:Sucrase/ferredoxin-like-domain-containing protein [Powellomyces hirtus]|nr:Sucrase/ferredoxin-like-domain-containing protein [Powellomyces hirtus]